MIDAVFNHRSIRKYKNDSISERLLNEILQAAIRGSNTGNMQMYSIIVTRKPEIKKQLWEVHFKQNMVVDAPIILTFVADINRFHKWCEMRNAEISYDNFLWFYNATIDATIAAQNACIAAEDNGLGICYLGTTTYNARKIVQILNLPQGVVPVTTVVVGYPAERPELTDRLPQDGVVFYEKYTDFTEQRINEIFAEKENSELTKSLIEQNKTENLAQVFTKYRYKRQDNQYFSKEFLSVILEQGFMNI